MEKKINTEVQKMTQTPPPKKNLLRIINLDVNFNI